jgi:hypothetical protein
LLSRIFFQAKAGGTLLLCAPKALKLETSHRVQKVGADCHSSYLNSAVLGRAGTYYVRNTVRRWNVLLSLFLNNRYTSETN